jgi:HSP20 family molecular chaperone IbpA
MAITGTGFSFPFGRFLGRAALPSTPRVDVADQVHALIITAALPLRFEARADQIEATVTDGFVQVRIPCPGGSNSETRDIVESENQYVCN